MEKNQKVRREVWWFKCYALISDFKSLQSIIAMLALPFSIYEFIWILMSSSGVAGSKKLFIVMGSISILCTGILILLMHFMRWQLLYMAVRSYIQSNMIEEFSKDCILVSCGPGGAFGVGIVSKVLQSMNMKVPKSIVVDCEYEKAGEPTVASVFSVSLSLRTKKCLIIHTYLGTGGSLKALRKALNIPDAPVFCFVMSESLAKHDPVEYCLFTGSRSVLPWPQSELHRNK